MQHKKDYNNNVSTKWFAVTTERTKRPTDIDTQKVRVMTIANVLYDTYVKEQKKDPQLFWNLVASVAHEYLDRDRQAFGKLMASFEKDEFFIADKSKIQKATYVPTDSPYFNNDVLFRIRFNALNERTRNEFGDLATGKTPLADGSQFSATKAAEWINSQFFAPIQTFPPPKSVEEMLFALEKNTGQLGTTFKDEYIKTSSSLVPTFNLPVTEYPVDLK